MRGIIIFLTILGSLPYTLMQPWIGVLVFSWISYMNPHKYAWGPVRTFPLAFVVALVTMTGMLMTKDRSRLSKDPAVVLMILLLVLFVFTTFFALNQEGAWIQLNKVWKIFLMTFVTVILINTRFKLKALLLVISLSVGLIGLKGGIWALKSGGTNRVYGPEGSFFFDNNDLALALNMALPLLLYLAKDEQRRWLKNLLRVCFVGSIVAIIFTYSRGGFLTLALVGFMLLIKAKYKSLAIIMLFFGIVSLAFITPGQWVGRMYTIETYQEDGSAMGRINAWKTSWNLALDRPFIGGGFEAWTDEMYERYSPNPAGARDVHSNYFEMLGEQGFIGLALYLMLLGYCLTTLSRLKWRSRHDPGLQWVAHYTDMLQVSILAYMLGGAFLGRAYFDFFYHLVASVVILKSLMLQHAITGAVVAKPVRENHYIHPAVRALNPVRQ
jgi:probable O-glycosylation ligase (exosortase A-associated)